MSDIKFSCPKCGQHITCDELWMGQQIACPSCQFNQVVPQVAAAPAAAAPASLVPTPPTQAKLSINRTPHVAHTPPPAAPGAPTPGRFTPMSAGYQAEPPAKKGGTKKVITIVVISLVCAVGIYFGFQWLLQVQAKANIARQAAEKNSSGGEMGETAGIYKALKDTDPDKFSRISSQHGLGRLTHHPSQGEQDAQDKDEDTTATAAPGQDAAATTATWTLSPGATAIPDGGVSGMIGGTNFVASTVRVDAVQGADVLRFTEGSLTAPDREVLVYLHLASGEMLSGKTLSITSDTHGPTNPGIVKRWKTNPAYAPQSKSFTAGYALKLEMGTTTAGVITGKIYLALPDPDKTVIAGNFKAVTDLK